MRPSTSVSCRAFPCKDVEHGQLSGSGGKRQSGPREARYDIGVCGG